MISSVLHRIPFVPVPECVPVPEIKIKSGKGTLTGTKSKLVIHEGNMAILYFFISLSLLLCCCPCEGHLEDLLSQANRLYTDAGERSSFLERQRNFNQALSLYLELERSQPLMTQSGALYQAIADCYFQLDHYALAILYGYRALQLDPLNPTINEGINRALQKLGLSPKISEDSLERVLSFNHRLPLVKRYELFFILGSLTLAIGSLAIWIPHRLLKKTLFFSSILTSLMLLNLVMTLYFSPIEGVLIESSGLYRGPDINQPQLLSFPILEGTKIKILDVSNHEWVKIASPEGDIGYIPINTLRMI